MLVLKKHATETLGPFLLASTLCSTLSNLSFDTICNMKNHNVVEYEPLHSTDLTLCICYQITRTKEIVPN
jgi:hypothetical protein